jgi:hypothetical protein
MFVQDNKTKLSLPFSKRNSIVRKKTSSLIWFLHIGSHLFKRNTYILSSITSSELFQTKFSNRKMTSKLKRTRTMKRTAEVCL